MKRLLLAALILSPMVHADALDVVHTQECEVRGELYYQFALERQKNVDMDVILERLEPNAQVYFEAGVYKLLDRAYERPVYDDWSVAREMHRVAQYNVIMECYQEYGLL